MAAFMCACRRLKLAAGIYSGLCWGLLVSTVAHADDVRIDDLIVTGSACIGTDCVNNELFDATTIRLKENNTRIRFYNTSSNDVLGKSWSLEANDSSNGGPSSFRFKAQSLTQDSIKRSDGQDIGKDCDAGDVYELEVPLSDLAQRGDFVPESVILPLGEPVNQYQESVVSSTSTSIRFAYTCINTAWWTEDLLLRMGNANDDIVTLGRESAPVSGSVSVGNPSALRAIKNVALPEAATDLLTVAALSLLPDRKARLDLLRVSIAAVESQLTTLENADADNDLVPNGTDAFPTDPTEWDDSDGDGVGDNADAFPNEPAESVDSDGDGIGDNADAFINALTNASDLGVVLTTTLRDSASTCSVDSFSVSAVDNEEAPGASIAQQAEFVLAGCAPGESLTVTIDFVEPFPPRAAAFKLIDGSWTMIKDATVRGQTISYTIQDNGPLDLAPAEGTIHDPVSVASTPLQPIPLPSWLLFFLAGSMAWLGSRFNRGDRTACDSKD